MEAQSRGYHYNAAKINLNADPVTVQVTRGQTEYEVEHLKKKLARRDRSAYERLLGVEDITLNPLFSLVAGEIESWETAYCAFVANEAADKKINLFCPDIQDHSGFREGAPFLLRTILRLTVPIE